MKESPRGIAFYTQNRPIPEASNNLSPGKPHYSVILRIRCAFQHTVDDTNPALPIVKNMPYFP